MRDMAAETRVLVVEDEASISEPLTSALEREGFEPVVARTAREAIELADRTDPDVVLLDLMLPDGDGRDVCRTLRRGSDVPIIMLTARGTEVDRIVGLELGADDYVVKPFSVRELLLRIDAILRRLKGEHTPDAPVEFGNLRIDQAAHRVWVGENEVELTALEFKLLLTLFARKNRVQSRAALLDDVWGVVADVTTRTVDTHVKRLRQKLGSAGDYIETVRGVGYRFADMPVREEAQG